MLADGDSAVLGVGLVWYISELNLTDDELGAIGGNIDDVC